VTVRGCSLDACAGDAAPAMSAAVSGSSANLERRLIRDLLCQRLTDATAACREGRVRETAGGSVHPPCTVLRRPCRTTPRTKPARAWRKIGASLSRSRLGRRPSRRRSVAVRREECRPARAPGHADSLLDARRV
jgi:hypothetical protein